MKLSDVIRAGFGESGRDTADAMDRGFYAERERDIDRYNAIESLNGMDMYGPEKPTHEKCAPVDSNIGWAMLVGTAGGAMTGASAGPIGSAVRGAIGAFTAMASWLFGDEQKIKKCLKEEDEEYEKQYQIWDGKVQTVAEHQAEERQKAQEQKQSMTLSYEERIRQGGIGPNPRAHDYNSMDKDVYDPASRSSNNETPTQNEIGVCVQLDNHPESCSTYRI